MKSATIKLIHTSGAKKIMDLADYDSEKEKGWSPATPQKSAAKKESAPVVEASPEPEAAEEPVQDWESMPWPAARKYIAQKTGTFPRTKEHAVELMAD